jgi:flagellar basal body-associated protein FliL
MKKLLIMISISLLLLLFSCSYVANMYVNGHETFYISDGDQEIMSIIAYESEPWP